MGPATSEDESSTILPGILCVLASVLMLGSFIYEKKKKKDA